MKLGKSPAWRGLESHGRQPCLLFRAGIPGVDGPGARPLQEGGSSSVRRWRSCLQFVKNTPEKSSGGRCGLVHLLPIRRALVERPLRAGRVRGCGHALQAHRTPLAVGRGVCPSSRTGLPWAGKPGGAHARVPLPPPGCIPLSRPRNPFLASEGSSAAPRPPGRWKVPSQHTVPGLVPRHRLTPVPASAPRPAGSRDTTRSGLLGVACSTRPARRRGHRRGPG